MLLVKLCKLATVPVVYVKREGVTPPVFARPVTTCHLDDLLGCLEEYFASKSKRSEG